MWQKLKEQLPAILLTAIIITAGGFWVHTQTVKEMTEKEEAQLAPLREQNESLKSSADENRRTIEATNKLLKDAISKREADMFRTDDEIQQLNGERMDALAEAIAKKVQPLSLIHIWTRQNRVRPSTGRITRVSKRPSAFTWA